jgi:hypothetical protein
MGNFPYDEPAVGSIFNGVIRFANRHEILKHKSAFDLGATQFVLVKVF